MESVLPQPVLPCDVQVDGVCADVFGDRLVELAVEDGDVAGAGQGANAVFYDFESRGVVEGLRGLM